MGADNGDLRLREAGVFQSNGLGLVKGDGAGSSLAAGDRGRRSRAGSAAKAPAENLAQKFADDLHRQINGAILNKRGELIVGDIEQLLKRYCGSLGGSGAERGSSGAGCQHKAQSGERTDKLFHLSSSCFSGNRFVVVLSHTCVGKAVYCTAGKNFFKNIFEAACLY